MERAAAGTGLAVHIGPEADPRLAAAVERAGGVVVGPSEAEMVVWSGFDPDGLRPLLHPGVRWVQLSGAGIERWLAAGTIDGSRTWMSNAGAGSDAIAEHALALVLAANRRLGEAARAEAWDRSLQGRSLRGQTVAVIGAGGIGRSLIELLLPHGVEVIAVTRRGLSVAAVAHTLPAREVGTVWGEADTVVLAAPATAATRHLVDAAALAAMRPGAVLVNVARGSLIDTEALLQALDAGEIGAAALDVTEPEPLPPAHRLWRHPRALITPHVANPHQRWLEAYAERVEENVGHIVAGRPPVAIVDPYRGY
jgi:phosphoglycerate dehydrogenase-like enzyme